jgi:hypothetical protein
LVTRLFECQNCYLCFRHPTDSDQENSDFYGSQYVENDGITTSLPTSSEVDELVSTGFARYPLKSLNRFEPVLRHCFKGKSSLRVIDYGASWGYLTYQFQELGHDAVGYEISAPRAEFGRKQLGVDIRISLDSLGTDYDLFFCSHVIEHVPNPSELLKTSAELVTHDGFAIILCPNGGLSFRKKNWNGFHTGWGKVHPNVMAPGFFQRALASNPWYIASTPSALSQIDKWNCRSQTIGDELDGDELIVVARPRMIINAHY